MKAFLISFAFIAAAIFVLQYSCYCAYAVRNRRRLASAPKPHQNLSKQATAEAAAASN